MHCIGRNAPFPSPVLTIHQAPTRKQQHTCESHSVCGVDSESLPGLDARFPDVCVQRNCSRAELCWPVLRACLTKHAGHCYFLFFQWIIINMVDWILMIRVENLPLFL
ncbi:hypothetical protein ASPWEDRAFT_323652 [Aspergillus wentii DTO 134E9]|uniref:Uncharacterized protein n=1 Tax=Aspergillus wentii DTO 134E9 TaxID=1073089 RepID=A0A1L9RU36_ASPWE|nr:uncharacterized protein ASPWEDRAFT_323652 [Aspergillus wentii DTO 134E9]OJJ38461.1 hypothetical protein ASPWEDRAFT_323652 [Aspergillus wentii DTO 134E9]